jgi:hypothetical protein
MSCMSQLRSRLSNGAGGRSASGVRRLRSICLHVRRIETTRRTGVEFKSAPLSRLRLLTISEPLSTPRPQREFVARHSLIYTRQVPIEGASSNRLRRHRKASRPPHKLIGTHLSSPRSPRPCQEERSGSIRKYFSPRWGGEKRSPSTRRIKLSSHRGSRGRRFLHPARAGQAHSRFRAGQGSGGCHIGSRSFFWRRMSEWPSTARRNNEGGR